LCVNPLGVFGVRRCFVDMKHLLISSYIFEGDGVFSDLEE